MIRLISFVKRQIKMFVWIFMSKQKFKSICWIFPVKTQMQINLFDFTCQKHKIDLLCNLISDAKWVLNEFVFWQEKSIWSTFAGYFSYFFQIKFTFWHEIQKIDFNFVFWQVKSNELICICVLIGKSLATRIQI